MTSRKATLSLRFIVVGGSVAGLCTAYALQTAGHQVLVLERTNGKLNVDGGLRSPPNMTRLLKRWPGMASMLDSMGTKCTGLKFKDGRTSETLGAMRLYARVMAELDGDFFLVQHADLCIHLVDICKRAGVRFKYKSTVVAVNPDPSGVTVVLKNGTQLKGDIVVGADGGGSIVREVVAGRPLVTIQELPGANVTVPTSLMKRDADLRSLCTSKEFIVWMGAGISICGGVDHGGQRYELAINSEPVGGAVGSDWYTNEPLDTISALNLAGLDPNMQKLLKLARTCHPTLHKVYEEQEDFVDRTNRIVLVGDAAHSSSVHGSHNTSMAVEDAVTLGNLFSRLSNSSQIPFILEAYEEIRQPRTSMTRAAELLGRGTVSLHPGLDKDLRDAAMRMTLEISFDDEWNEDEETLLAQNWRVYLVLFYYDASEAVDDWWGQFGGLVENR